MCIIMIIIACRSNMTKPMFSVFWTFISIFGNGLNASRMILCALWWSSLHALDGGMLKQIWTSFWKTTLLSPWIHIVYRETINLKMLVVCSTNGFGYCTVLGRVGWCWWKCCWAELGNLTLSLLRLRRMIQNDKINFVILFCGNNSLHNSSVC